MNVGVPGGGGRSRGRGERGREGETDVDIAFGPRSYKRSFTSKAKNV